MNCLYSLPHVLDYFYCSNRIKTKLKSFTLGFHSFQIWMLHRTDEQVNRIPLRWANSRYIKYIVYWIVSDYTTLTWAWSGRNPSCIHTCTDEDDSLKCMGKQETGRKTGSNILENRQYSSWQEKALNSVRSKNSRAISMSASSTVQRDEVVGSRQRMGWETRCILHVLLHKYKFSDVPSATVRLCTCLVHRELSARALDTQLHFSSGLVCMGRTRKNIDFWFCALPTENTCFQGFLIVVSCFALRKDSLLSSFSPIAFPLDSSWCTWCWVDAEHGCENESTKTECCECTIYKCFGFWAVFFL